MQHESAQLLVIDEDDSTHAIIPILEQCGYSLTVLADVSASRDYERTEFDVIIRGSTACQPDTPLSIKVFRNTPVLVVTGSNDMDEVIKCLESGVADYIGLPCHSTIIKARIDGYTKRAKLRTSKARYTRFLAMELKNPLTSIRGYAEILAGDYAGAKPIGEEQRIEFARIIRRNATRLLRFISESVALTDIEADSLRVRPENTPLDPIVKDAITSLRDQIKAKEQSLIVEIPETVPNISGDHWLLQQVISALVENAHQYTTKGGQIRLTAQPLQDMVQVSVHDTGIGIAPEHEAKIFQPFYRVDDPIVYEVFGYGLSLAIAKGMIEAHGGRIWFESTPGVGSTFHFTVPVARD